jgi:hypothetical protein
MRTPKTAIGAFVDHRHFLFQVCLLADHFDNCLYTSSFPVPAASIPVNGVVHRYRGPIANCQLPIACWIHGIRICGSSTSRYALANVFSSSMSVAGTNAKTTAKTTTLVGPSH